MAIDSVTLDQLCSRGWGPLTFARTGGDVEATLGEGRATLTLDRGTVRIVARSSVSRPQGVDEAIRIALKQLSLARPELVDIAANGDGVQTTLWLDAEASGPAHLAGAIRSVIVLSDLAADAIRQIDLDAQTQARLRRESDQTLEELRRAMRTTDEAEEVSAPAPVAAAAPTPAPVAAPAPAPAHVPAPAPPPPPPPPGGFLFRVDQPTDLVDGKGAVVGRLHPGRTYTAQTEAGGWVYTTDDEQRAGWAPATSVRR